MSKKKSFEISTYKLNNAKKKLQNHSKKPFNSKKLQIKKRIISTFGKSVLIEAKKNTRINAAATIPEERVKEILNIHKIPFKTEYELCGKFYDFYLPKQTDLENDVLIEVDGIYWHGKNQDTLTMKQTKQRIEDLYKNCIAMLKNMKLIRVWEDEIFEDELIKEITYCKNLTASL